MGSSKKEINKIIEAVESLEVEVVDYTIARHLKLMVKNPATGTLKMITVSLTPKAKGVYHEIKSSVRKVFRKEGEYI